MKGHLWKICILTGIILCFTSCSRKAGEAYLPADIEKNAGLTENEHGETNFQDMQYNRPDSTEFYDIIAGIRDVAEDAANENHVKELYGHLVDLLREWNTMYVLADIYYSLDTTSLYYQEETAFLYALMQEGEKELLNLEQFLLKTPCSVVIQEKMEENQDGNMQAAETEEETDLLQQERILIQQYNENIDQEDGEDMAELYKKLAEKRSAIASASGHQNYMQYQYKRYGRDYKPEDITVFRTKIKENVKPQYEAIASKYDWTGSLDEYVKNIDREQLLPDIGIFMHQISSDLGESFDYMIKYGLYDLKDRENKLPGSFTVSLQSFHSLFLFSQPEGEFWDITTIIHEFGHFNSAYWYPEQVEVMGENLDLSEAHSQTLELLFMQYYEELLPDIGRDAVYYTLDNVLYTFLFGCLVDEFEWNVYKTPYMTIEEMDTLYTQLEKEYGLYEEDTNAYDWTKIGHLYQSPAYYISYPVAMAPALEIWLSSLQDKDAAVVQYTQLVSKGRNMGFLDALEECGLSNPMAEEYNWDTKLDKLSEYVNMYKK